MKKLCLFATIAALFMGLMGCESSSESDVIYRIAVSLEGENSKMFLNTDNTVKDAYNAIEDKLSAFESEVSKEWVVKGDADKDAKAEFDKAAEKLNTVTKEAEEIIAAIPEGSTGKFTISRSLILKKIAAGSADGDMASKSFKVQYPAK